MKRLLGIAFGIVLVFVVIVLLARRPGCDKEQYLEQVGPLLERWDDAHAIASSTARIALGTQVNELVAIKQATEHLDVGSCAGEAQALLVQYMDATIESFLAFMAQESDEEVADLVEKANSLLDDWAAAVENLE